MQDDLELSPLPELRFLGINVEWICWNEYYDGPLTGLVKSNDEIFWAVCFLEENKSPHKRHFIVFRMPDEWMKRKLKRHELWKECCGNYCFDLPEGHKPTRPIEEFYAKYPPGKNIYKTIEDEALELGRPIFRFIN